MSLDDSTEALPSAAEELARARRTLRMVIACHEVVATAGSEQELFDGICEILVDRDHYQLAWIGRPLHDEYKSVIPVASRGFADGYLERLVIRWGDDEYSRGPTGRAVITGNSVVNQNIRENPDFAPWHEQAAKFGYQSSAAIACPDSGESPRCVLNLYSDKPNAFDAEEVALLESLAADMAFGSRHLEIALANKEAEKRHRSVLGETVNAIAAALEHRDPYTTGHQVRVAELATAISTKLGWPESRIEGIHLGAIIHDIGKIAVPAALLNRPGPLTDTEFELIKTHALSGWEIVRNIDFPWPVHDIVLQHHERLDGSGYPNGLIGDEMSEEAKIVAVADVVEAMSSDRPYRPGLGIGPALYEIERGKGVVYDTEAVDACLKVFREDGFEWELAQFTSHHD